jgi:hypothetical protein
MAMPSGQHCGAKAALLPTLPILPPLPPSPRPGPGPADTLSDFAVLDLKVGAVPHANLAGCLGLCCINVDRLEKITHGPCCVRQRRLGSGGHGTVFVATTRAGAAVAVKVSDAAHSHNDREAAAVGPAAAGPCARLMVHIAASVRPGSASAPLTRFTPPPPPCVWQMTRLFSAPHSNVVRWLRPAMRDDRERRMCQVRSWV